MLILRGMLKYAALFLLCGWMFFVGVMVGRGTAPVNFDTQAFQKKLIAFYEQFSENENVQQKPELNFYDALKKPEGAGAYVADTTAFPIENPSEKGYRPEKREKPDGMESDQDDLENTDAPPLKKSKKALTYSLISVKKKLSQYPLVSQKSPSDTGDGASEDKPSLKTRTAAESLQNYESAKKIHLPEKNYDQLSFDESKEKNMDTKAKYAIQIASFVDENDAEKYMLSLKSKGFFPYMASVKINGKTWHRVKTGSFESIGGARKYLEKLESYGIKGIILSKE